jgi:hypothetical protein
VMDQFTRRIIGFGVHCGIVDGVALCRMFHRAIRGHRAERAPAGTACGRNGITYWSRFVPVAEALSRLVPNSDSRLILLNLIRHARVGLHGPRKTSMLLWSVLARRVRHAGSEMGPLAEAASYAQTGSWPASIPVLNSRCSTNYCGRRKRPP